MNGKPSPTLTSSTIASAPPATFDMIEDAMSGTMSTVPATSQGRFPVRRTRSAVCPTIVLDLPHLRDELVGRELDAVPGSTRACRASRRCGRAHALTSSRRTPQAATIGPTASDVLSPTPPRRVLVHDPPTEGRAEVERLPGADHRVRMRTSRAAGEPAGSRRPCTRRPSCSPGCLPMCSRRFASAISSSASPAVPVCARSAPGRGSSQRRSCRMRGALPTQVSRRPTTQSRAR